MALQHRSASLALAVDRRAVSSYLCRGCALRSLHTSSVYQAESSSRASSSNAQQGKASPKRIGSQLATAMLKGLRDAAPGGFGRPQSQATKQPAQGGGQASSAGKPQQQGEKGRPARPIFRKVMLESDGRQSPRSSVRIGTGGQYRPPGTNKGFSPRTRETEDEGEVASVEKEILTPEQIAERRDILKAKQKDVEEAVEHLAKEKQRKMVSQLRRGDVMRFESMQDRDAAIKSAGGLAFKPLDAKYRQLVTMKQLEGKYQELEGPKGSSPREKTLSHLRTVLKLNASCSKAMEEAIEQVVAKRWTAPRSA